MIFNFQFTVVSWTLFVLALCECSVALMLYEDDLCDFAGYDGICLPASKCFQLQSIMQELGLKSYHVGRCGFTVTEELICCPKWPTPVQTPPELPNEFIDFSKGFVFPTPQVAENFRNPAQPLTQETSNNYAAENDNLDDRINAIFSGATSNSNGLLNSASLLDVHANKNSNGLLNENSLALSGNTNDKSEEKPEQAENLDDILKKIFNAEPALNEKPNVGLRPETTSLDENINEKIQNIFSGNTISVGNQNQNSLNVQPITDEDVNEKIKNIFAAEPVTVEGNLNQPKDTNKPNQAPSGDLNERPFAGSALNDDYLSERLKNIFNLNPNQDKNLLNEQQDMVGVNPATVGVFKQNSHTGNSSPNKIPNENITNIFNVDTIPLEKHNNKPSNEFNGSSHKDRLPVEKPDESINNLWSESLKPVGDLNDNATANQNLNTKPLTNFTEGKLHESIINIHQPHAISFGEKVPERNLNTNSIVRNSTTAEELSEETQNPNTKELNVATPFKGNPWLDEKQFNGSPVEKNIAEVNSSAVPIESVKFMPSRDTVARDGVIIETIKHIFEGNSVGNRNENSKTINFGHENPSTSENDNNNGAFNWHTVPVGDIKVGTDNLYLNNEFQGTPGKYEPTSIPYPPDIPAPPPPPLSESISLKGNGVPNNIFKGSAVQDGLSKEQIERTIEKDSSVSDGESSETIGFPFEYSGNPSTFEEHNTNDFLNKHLQPAEPINFDPENLQFENKFSQPRAPYGNKNLLYGPPPPYGYAFDGGNPNRNTQNIQFEDEENDNQVGFSGNTRRSDSTIHDVIRDSAFDLANRLSVTRQKAINNLRTVNPFRNYLTQTRNQRRRHRNWNRSRFHWH